jgi:hypothetical protein
MHLANKRMTADYVPLSDDVVKLSSTLEWISEQIQHAFAGYHHPDAFPPHLNVLGFFLIHKYKMLRSELAKFGDEQHFKQEARNLVPINGMYSKYRNLTVYIDSLIKVPDIHYHLEEVASMVMYASNPTPITST